MLFVLLIGSATALWLHWQPWTLQTKVAQHVGNISFVAFTEDCKRVLWIDDVVHISDAQSGVEISSHPAPSDLVPISSKRPIAVGLVQYSNGNGYQPPMLKEPWREAFRARHPEPVSFVLKSHPMDEALEYLLGSVLKEKYVIEKWMIDFGSAHTRITLTVKNINALDALEQILQPAGAVVEFEDGTLRIVSRTNHDDHVWARARSEIIIGDLETGQEVATLSGNTPRIMKSVLSEDGTHLFTVDEKGRVRIWDIPARKLRAELDIGVTAVLNAVISNDGKRFAVQLDDWSISAWCRESRTSAL